MVAWLSKAKSFLREEEGASAVEYGLLVAGIAVAIIVSVYALGTKINGMFDTIGTKLS